MQMSDVLECVSHFKFRIPYIIQTNKMKKIVVILTAVALVITIAALAFNSAKKPSLNSEGIVDTSAIAAK
jgi:hypothetical protein